MAERGERREFVEVDAVRDGSIVGSTILAPPSLDGMTLHDALQRFEIRVMGTRIAYEEDRSQNEVLITRSTSEKRLRKKARKAIALKLTTARQGTRPQSVQTPVAEIALAR